MNKIKQNRFYLMANLFGKVKYESTEGCRGRSPGTSRGVPGCGPSRDQKPPREASQVVTQSD